MTGVHVLEVGLRPLLSVCAALLGATIVASFVLLSSGDSPAASTPASAASEAQCGPDGVCREIVRVDANGIAFGEPGISGTGASVHLEPTNQSVAAGEDVIVEVWVDNVVGLADYEIELAYEPSVLAFSSIQNSSFLGSTGRAVTCLPTDFRPASFLFGCVTSGANDQEGPTGDGLLTTVTLSSSCAGVSPLSFLRVTLGDILGATIPSTSEDGNVTVTGGDACPTPTVTPTPEPATATATYTASPTATAVGQTPTQTDTPGPSPTPTVTVTGTPPTATPTATWTQVPTWTPEPTWTPVPTWTPDAGPPSPTDTPVPTATLLGDTSCDGIVGPVDATLILQLWTRLVDALPCPTKADADGNGSFELIDATVILQYSTRMIASLPP